MRRLLALVVLLSLACSVLAVPGVVPATQTPAPVSGASTHSATGEPAAATLAATTPLPLEPPTPDVNWSNEQDQAQALLEAFAADATDFPAATRYWIEASVTFDRLRTRAVIEGRERVRFTNPLHRPLEEIALMLWPNDAQYAAEMEAGSAVVDGRLVIPQAEAEGVGLRVPLARPLAPGEVVDLTIPFRVVTTDPITLWSPRRFGIAQGMLMAPTFYPLIPRLTPAGEWQMIPAPPGGDTANSDVALYDVRLIVPEELVLVATGVELDRTPVTGGTVAVHYASGPVRDFAFALGPFVPAQSQAGGVVARAWALPEHAAEAESLARTAARAVQAFETWIGPYPYDELDVIDAPGAFGGIEYPGLIFIGVVGDRADDDVVIHEVAHQWFYALIGNDQLLEPWLDEGAASYLETLYYEAEGDVRTATRLLDEDRRILRAVGRTETPIGLPVGVYASENDYAVFVYLKGALFFDALRGRLGETAFGDFLHTYFADYRYGFATARAFQTTAEATCECDLTDLFDLWVYEGGELPLP
jgi:hypothetical protein